LPPVSFATGINNTTGSSGKICHRCRWYRWCTLTCQYLRECSKNMIWYHPNDIFTGLGEDDSWKQPEAKSLWHFPLRFLTQLRLRIRPLYSLSSRGGHRHLQIGRMLDIDLSPPTPPPPRCMNPKCGNLVGQRGRKRFIASWGLRISHICPCTPCPSPQG